MTALTKWITGIAALSILLAIVTLCSQGRLAEAPALTLLHEDSEDTLGTELSAYDNTLTKPTSGDATLHPKISDAWHAGVSGTSCDLDNTDPGKYAYYSRPIDYALSEVDTLTVVVGSTYHGASGWA